MDDVPLGELKRRKEAEGEDSDSDDELTLADILSKINTGKKKKSTNKKKAKKTASKSASTSKKRSREAAPKTSRKKVAASAVRTDCPLSTGNPTFKHEIVEKILCRWKHVLEGWPVEPPLPPKDFMVTGFPGVFVGIGEDNLGEIKDTRDKTLETAPIQKNLIEQDTAHLKDLLIVALDRQAADLRNNKGGETLNSYNSTLRILERELQETRRYKDKKHEKVYQSWTKRQ